MDRGSLPLLGGKWQGRAFAFVPWHGSFRSWGKGCQIRRTFCLIQQGCSSILSKTIRIRISKCAFKTVIAWTSVLGENWLQTIQERRREFSNGCLAHRTCMYRSSLPPTPRCKEQTAGEGWCLLSEGVLVDRYWEAECWGLTVRTTPAGRYCMVSL